MYGATNQTEINKLEIILKKYTKKRQTVEVELFTIKQALDSINKFIKENAI